MISRAKTIDSHHQHALAARAGQPAMVTVDSPHGLSAHLVGAQLAAVQEVWDCESGHLPSAWQSEFAALPVQINLLLHGATPSDVERC